MRRLKTLRRPPIYPKIPGHLPCSSLTHPLPLPSRRPSVSFGGFGVSLTTVRDVGLRQHFPRRYANDGVSGSDQQADQHPDAVSCRIHLALLAICAGCHLYRTGGARLSLVLPCRGALESPPNPVDPEQLEGRVHRYHGHAIQKNIAQKVGAKGNRRVQGRARTCRTYHAVGAGLLFRRR